VFGVSSRWDDRRVHRLLITTVWLALASSSGGGEPASISLGSPAHGSLQGGVSLPAEGDGFVTYSSIGHWLGRQYVNSRVRDALAAAFVALHSAQPDRQFVVGETGLRNGGRFRPHRSHQNGLSVDIFMPLRDAAGRRVLMPTQAWRKFGYSMEFDAQGRGDGLVIDFRSVAELLAELNRQAPKSGLVIERIIVAPEYVERVLGAGGSSVAPLEPVFMRKPAWVRHDEHVHVDFRITEGKT
jgi:penicillin-insensitive murein DD-endopeptidase